MLRSLAAALIAVALLPGCKRKAAPEAAPAPTPVAATDAAVRPGVPPPTAPDPEYATRRDELLRRGDPTMMKPAPTMDTKAPEPTAADLVKVVSRDVMMVGAIRVDLKAGTAALPAKMSYVTGPLEYVAVGAKGKAYESMLTVTASVVELRLALTLLGLEGTVPDADGKVAAPTAADTVLAALRVGAKEQPLASVLIDRRTGKAPPDAPWQVIGFRDSDRAAALRTDDLMTLVPRDVIAPLRLTIDAGNPYAGPDQGIAYDAARLPAAGGDVTLILKRRPDGPAPRPPSPGAANPAPAAPAAPESP